MYYIEMIVIYNLCKLFWYIFIIFFVLFVGCVFDNVKYFIDFVDVVISNFYR